MAELLTMPEVATGTLQAILSSWNVDVEKPFSAGDSIVTVETEKAIVDVEAEADGVLLHVLVPAGASVEVGAPIAVKGTPGETVDDVGALLTSLGVADGEASSSARGGDHPTAVPPNGEGRIFVSPLARKLAKQAGLDLATVTGTGPHGRIRRADIESMLRDRAAAPTPSAPAPESPPAPAPRSSPAPALEPSPAVIADAAGATYTDVPNSRARQAVARRLTESKQTAPHFYLRGSARVDRLLELRRELNDGGAVKISLDDLLVKAIGRAHTVVPGLNVQWNGDSIRHFTGVDVAVAVATEHGLVTPVVRGVDTLSISRLAAITGDLVARAKQRRLKQSELEGGTVSVTNLGMYGIEEFAAIINPPHASILAVGAARQEAVVDDGELAVATVLHVSLAVDHRPVDGVTAAEWMRVFTGLLERPAQILA